MKLKIYQIDTEKDRKRLRFADSYTLQRILGAFRVNPSIYTCVFDGELPALCLQDVFLLCNQDVRPKGYEGCSMSVSDVIVVKEGVGVVAPGCYFCDSWGFKEILFDTTKTIRKE